MVTAALRHIETLQTLLDTVDPTTDAKAGDKIAAMAVALRDTMVRLVPASEFADEADEASATAL